MRLEAARLVLAGALFLTGCASQSTHPDAFAFAIVGDQQYNAAEEAAFDDMLERIGRDRLAFVIHVGDIVGAAPCDDALYARRKREYDDSAHPFIYTPGDNEWTDCRSAERGGHDPRERLALIRRTFFADGFSLGRRRIELMAQRECVEARGAECACPALPENRFWYRGGVRFVTLNVSGSENNTTGDAANAEEARCRNAANRAWLDMAVRASERSETRALVIVFHANPWYSQKGSFTALLRQVEDAARRVRKPVLLVHGDTHLHRADTPFAETRSITRLETFGSPFVGWVRVTVDPEDPLVFAFEPKLYKVVAP